MKNRAAFYFQAGLLLASSLIVDWACSTRPRPQTRQRTQTGTKQNNVEAVSFGAQCADHLRTLFAGMKLYAADWDDTLPEATLWMDALQPYLLDQRVYSCPAADQGYGYAFNWDLGKRVASQLKPQQEMPLIYDSTLSGPSATDTFASLPTPPRHDGYNNVLYLDGHVQAQESK